MRNLSALIYQCRPFHQIYMHQTLNSIGFYKVYVRDDYFDVLLKICLDPSIKFILLDYMTPKNEIYMLFELLSLLQVDNNVIFVGNYAQDIKRLIIPKSLGAISCHIVSWKGLSGFLIKVMENSLK